MESSETALATATSSRAIIMKDALAQATEQRALLKAYVEQHMVEGTDYGVIPGTKGTKSLLKPGAEKLVELFRCTPKFKLMKTEEDFEKGFFNYMFRVQLVSRDVGAVVAEGYGSANSREGRYRWRLASRKCPACGKESIIQGKAEYGGGWVCFKKKGGCGAKYGDADPAIVGQPQGQVENDDIATLANTILKMAKKRAQVDGAIALARCSDMFTQDVEDMEHPPVEDVAPQAAPQQSTRSPAPPPQAPAPPPQQAAKPPAAPAAPQKVTLPPAMRNRANRLWINAKAKRMDAIAFEAWVTDILGANKPSNEFTEEDLDRLEVAQREPPEQKPPSDDDVPF